MEELNLIGQKKLDGWLTLFGNFYAVRQMRFEDAIKNTMIEGLLEGNKDWS
ncbi:MAG: hypothetical protein QXH75_00690 [Sulfolobaceae archaeon]